MKREPQEGFKMVWLKYYGREQKEYPTEYELKVSDKTAELIVSKLKRHFKIKASLRFFGSSQSGLCSYSAVSRVRLSHNPSIGLICHELTHAYVWQKEGKRGHNKRHARAFRKAVLFLRKKNYFLDSETFEKIRGKNTVFLYQNPTQGKYLVSGFPLAVRIPEPREIEVFPAKLINEVLA